MKKKVLFIDRDGTLIVEPSATYQIDTLEQLEFLPHALRNLYFIRHNLDFEWAMVSNQDGLGTPAYPQEHFDLVQGKMLQALRNEGVTFDRIFIDKSMPEEGLPTRKPGTGMLTEYIGNDRYDLPGSFVIGDRATDVELARNLGCRAILLNGDALCGRTPGARPPHHARNGHRPRAQPGRHGAMRYQHGAALP